MEKLVIKTIFVTFGTFQNVLGIKRYHELTANADNSDNDFDNENALAL